MFLSYWKCVIFYLFICLILTSKLRSLLHLFIFIKSLYIVHKFSSAIIYKRINLYSQCKAIGNCVRFVCFFSPGFFPRSHSMILKCWVMLGNHWQIFLKTQPSFSLALFLSKFPPSMFFLSWTQFLPLQHHHKSPCCPQNICSKVGWISAKIFHLRTNAQCNPCGQLQ